MAKIDSIRAGSGSINMLLQTEELGVRLFAPVPIVSIRKSVQVTTGDLMRGGGNRGESFKPPTDIPSRRGFLEMLDPRIVKVFSKAFPLICPNETSPA